MFKKLAVPIFVLSMATYGCSSDSSPNPGTGGSSGGTTGRGGTGGSAGTTGGGGSGGSAGTTGGGGSGGGSAGTTGGGGSGGTGSAGTTGRGGGSGGSGAAGGTGTGGTGGGAAGSGGTGGGAAGSGGTGGGAGGSGGTGGSTLLACSVTGDTAANQSDVLSKEAFCQNFLATCTSSVSGFTPPYATQAACETAYAAFTVAQQHCRSYHLCWGAKGLPSGTANPGTHCPHAAGNAPCN